MNFAVFGAGCFWCVEAIFLQIDGVSEVISGYTGGKTKNPTYEDICTGTTGHVEVCKIVYDPKIVSYENLLKIFWENHDPTTLNKQGADSGTQYRSAVFYITEEEKNSAIKYKKILEENKIFDSPIVTEITKLGEFYKAEDYHQNYYNNNPNQPYCKFVIKPKLDKYFMNNNY
ncbi:MAG: peptide-methionine (S)-S-oxide reductase [Gammaproteobacteria bacterium]|nr:peptide-methionine (S)-S-oxide reductase [Gammaproteobacteria bacterium]